MSALRTREIIKVVGVPVGTDEFAIESAKGIVRDRGAENSRGRRRECRVQTRRSRS